MSDEEAKAVAGVLAGVDGQCYVCAGSAARDLQRALPDRDWLQLVADAGRWTREELVDFS